MNDRTRSCCNICNEMRVLNKYLEVQYGIFEISNVDCP